MAKVIVFLGLVIFLAGCTTAVTPGIVSEDNASTTEVDLAGGEGITVQPDEWAGEGMPLLVWDDGEVVLQIANPLTGENVKGKEPLNLGVSGSMPHAFAISPERDKIVIATGSGVVCSAYSGGSRCITGSDTLHVVDLESWEAHSFPIRGEKSGLEKGWVVGKPLLSPDGSRVTIAYATPETNTVLQYICDTGVIVARRSLDFAPELLAYTEAGDRAGILVHGTPEGEEPGLSKPPPPQVVLLDSITLEPLGMVFEDVRSGYWCLENCGEDHAMMRFAYWKPGTALSPDGNRFYLVHPGEEMISIFDLVKMDVIEMPIGVAQSGTGIWTWLDGLLGMTASRAYAKGLTEGELVFTWISPDGDLLYIARQIHHPDLEEPTVFMSMQVVAIEDGSVVNQIDAPDSIVYINQLRLTSNGEHIVLVAWDKNGAYTQIYNAVDLQLLSEIEGWEITPAQTLGGVDVLLGVRYGNNQTEMAVIDPDHFDGNASWSVDGFATWIHE